MLQNIPADQPYINPAVPGGVPENPLQNPLPPINVGGWSPQQYQNFIENDPGYMGLKASLGANEDAFKGSMRGAIQKAYMNSGYNIPELSGYLDSGMADQAASNPYSQAALASQSHQNNMRAIQNALAARGGYDSGELTYGIGNEGQRFNVEGLQNRGALADYIGGLQNNYANMSAQDSAQLASELGNATARQLALHPSSETTTANYDPASGSYVDAHGNHYDANGNVLKSAAPTPQASPTPSQPSYSPPTPTFGATAADFGISGPNGSGGYQPPNQFTYRPPASVPGNLLNHLLGLPN